MKKQLAYWIPTGLLLLMMMSSAVMYFVNSAEVAKIFMELGYPVYSMYFNATAKLLGGIAIILPMVPRFLKEWAYAGYLYIALLATQAMFMTMPGIPWVMLPFFILFGLSYWQFTKRTA